jgi:regulatory protein
MKSNQESKPKNRPLELALYYLSRQAQTIKQIRDKLTRKEFESSEIEAVINRLKELGFLDDAKYAKDFIRISKLGKPKGKYRIRLELIKKGIDKELIEVALEEGFDEGEQEELIDAAAKVYLKKIRNLPREKVYTRLMGYLLRRGFDYGKVSGKVKEILKDL